LAKTRRFGAKAVRFGRLNAFGFLRGLGLNLEVV